ncbi:SPOSA6832_04171, partial [Sporobolomyces salmonicolor]
MVLTPSFPRPGQVASATSTNNFINFCLLRTDLVRRFPRPFELPRRFRADLLSLFMQPLTNGQQVKTGSCNGVPMGVIGSQSTMPSAKFVNPPNLGTIPANQDFTIQMKINNVSSLLSALAINDRLRLILFPRSQLLLCASKHRLERPHHRFVLLSASPGHLPPSRRSAKGHSHVVIENIDSLGSTTVTNPQQFAFFKGLNDAAVNGVLSTDVAGGLPAGTYKMSSINTAANHQPALVAVAQHGSLDDAVYFTVSDNGAGTAATTTAESIAAGVTSTIAAASLAAGTTAAATTTTSASQGGGGNGFGTGGFGKGFGKGFVKRYADAQQQQQPQKRSLLQRRLEALELLELA